MGLKAHYPKNEGSKAHLMTKIRLESTLSVMRGLESTLKMKNK